MYARTYQALTLFIFGFLMVDVVIVISKYTLYTYYVLNLTVRLIYILNQNIDQWLYIIICMCN